MFCSQCGEPKGQGAKFCANCGTGFPSSAPSLAEPSSGSLAAVASNSNQIRPWVRYWARMFDVCFFTLLSGMVVGVVSPQLIEGLNETVLGLMFVFAWVFVEALLLSSFQTTPGKWLFKTKIALTSGTPIDFAQALTRSLKVWWRGFGIGFPIATIITMTVAHHRLTRDWTTSWDKDGGFLVTHETIGAPRVLAALAFFFVVLVFVGIGSSANS